ncbi:hypothetical protein ACFL6P_03625 [Candidatus Latescibacterota bacterium]
MRTDFEGMLPGASRWHEVHSSLDAEKLVAEEFFKELFYITNARAIQRQKREIMQNKGLSWEKINWKTHIRSNLFDFSIYPNYYWFRNVVNDDTMNEFDLLIGAYLRWKVFHFITLRNRLPWDIAASELVNSSFQDFLDSLKRKYISHELIELKSEEFVNIFLTLSKTDEQTFDTFICEFLERNMFVQAEAGQFFEEYFSNVDIDINKIYSQWITANELPKYEISDVKYLFYNVQRSGRVHNMCATIMNVSDVPGVFTVEVWDKEENIQLKNVFLEPGQAKKVGFVSRIPFMRYIGFNCFMSDNEYNSYQRPFVKKANINETPYEGVQIVPTPPTQHELGHIEIDNLDDGFSVLPAPPLNKGRTGFLSWFSKSDSEKSPFSKYDRKNPPITWTLTRNTGFQGYEYGVHYVKSGDGKQCVQWETNIIRPGKYRVQFFVPNKRTLIPPGPGIGKLKVSDFHFTIHHDGGVTEKILDMKQVNRGWRSLGEFEFSKGPARVVLSDKSSGKFVYADTVKFDIIE